MAHLSHKSLVDECEALGLTVKRIPHHGLGSAYNATGGGARVYWVCSISGTVSGCPRVVVQGRDTHANNLKTIRYLVKG